MNKHSISSAGSAAEPLFQSLLQILFQRLVRGGDTRESPDHCTVDGHVTLDLSIRTTRQRPALAHGVSFKGYLPLLLRPVGIIVLLGLCRLLLRRIWLLIGIIVLLLRRIWLLIGIAVGTRDRVAVAII